MFKFESSATNVNIPAVLTHCEDAGVASPVAPVGVHVAEVSKVADIIKLPTPCTGLMA